MSLKKKMPLISSSRFRVVIGITFLSLFIACLSYSAPLKPGMYPLTLQAIGQALGWVQDNRTICGGYFEEEPILYPLTLPNTHAQHLIEITSKKGLLSRRHSFPLPCICNH